MGSGRYNVPTYTARVAQKAAAGIPTFDHSAAIHAGTRSAAAHDLLDPKSVNKNGPHSGRNIRECMVSADHSDPTAIAVVLDVTGSNFHAATVVHSKLPSLVGTLQRVVYLETFEQHGKKGFAFFIGDEMPYQTLVRDFGFTAWSGARHSVLSLTGDSLEADISTKTIFDELQERYHVFFLFQEQGSYTPEQIIPAWQAVLGEREKGEKTIVLPTPDQVCEVIASLIARVEGLDQTDIDSLLKTDFGASASTVLSVSKAVSTVPRGAASVAVVEGDDGALDASGLGGATRV
jgi:hypothetical protein